MFVGTGPFAVYFLAIYAPIVVLIMFGAVRRWRKRALETRAWLSGGINPPKEGRLGPTGKAIVLCAGISALAVLLAVLVLASWGHTGS